MDLVTLIISATYFYFPAATANLGANFGKYLPWKYPVDCGLKIRGIQLVGNHKTMAGFFLGIFCGMLVAFLQMLISRYTDFKYEIFDYTPINTLILAFTMPFGALLGDLVESFIKRQLSLKPHARVAIFDQVDHIIGSLGLTSLFFPIAWQVWLVCFIVYFLLHEVTTKIGYFLGIKSVPY